MYNQYEGDTLKKLQKTELRILNDFIDICENNKLKYFMTFGSAIGAVRHKGFVPWDDDIDVGMLRDDYSKLLEIMDKNENKQYYILTPKKDDKYAGTVTKFQKRNTRFIPYETKHLKCDQCISIDIFVFDNIADEPGKRKRQIRYAWIIGKLIILRENPYPNIPLSGISKVIAKAFCFIIHYILVSLNISVTGLYNKFLKIITRYNNIQTRDVATFEDSTPSKNIISKAKMLPFKQVKFENIMVNILNNNDEMLIGMYGDYMKLPSEEERPNHYPYLLDFGKDNND